MTCLEQATLLAPPSPSTRTTLVLGSSGKTGRRIAARLHERGCAVRSGSRTASPAFHWEDPSTWSDVLSDVAQMVVILPSSLPIAGTPARFRALVQVAEAHGVERLVLVSGRGEAACLEWEAALRESSLAWTVLRSAWFQQNLSEGDFAPMVRDGALAVSHADVPEPFVDLDDLADVAVAVLSGPGHDGEILEVTGPRLISFRQLAGVLTEALGRPIGIEALSQADLLAAAAAGGASEEELGLIDYLFGALLDGRNAHLGDGVQRVLGRAPRDVAAFACAEAASGRWDTAPQSVVRRLIEQGINGGNEAVLTELLHHDYVYRAPGEELRGPAALQALFAGYRQAFPDLHVAITGSFDNGFMVATTFTLSGTHAGPLHGMPASGRSVSVDGIVHSRVRDGRIAEEWELIDMAALMQQLSG
ncbi:hypothetical protein EVJ50_11235 [Synechococcus sp. RSCCF101]|uniref:ester cyclase n=1 Tax=Synechococcus sp. RSCCF101 TaxID=2511069 RepID=UPI001244269E|nr:ester cyclase [Synechococcus sp. RSCCF101]QEY32714.1 hypothetical protein EVJ50_11235 [Synechococcus sp. RSCCF101]